MALPRSWIKYRSPISAGATVSAAPPPAPWKILAAINEPNDSAFAAHTEASIMRSVATMSTGRRPVQLDSGTHQMLAAPSMRTWTCR